MPNNLLTGLVGYWKLDETSGTRVDSHSNGLDLTDNNTVGYGTGVISNAGDFVRTNSEYLSRADNALFDVGANYSVSTWVNFDTTDDQGIISVGTFSGSDVCFILGFDGGSDVWIRMYNDALAAIAKGTGSQASLYDVGNWHHYVAVYDGGGATNADRLKIYRDGSALTLSFAGTIPATSHNQSTGLDIGRFTGVGNYMNGLIDETGLWNVSLTSTQVSDLYNSGSGLAYSSFDSGSSTTIKTLDGVTNANIKTILGVTRANVKTWNGVT